MNQISSNKTSPNNSTVDNDAEVIDLANLLATIIDSRRMIFLTTLLFAIIAVVYALLATPIYKSNALIQVEDTSAGIFAIDGIDDMFATESSTDTEIYILESRFIVGQTVDDLNLTNVIRPNYFPVLGSFFVRRHKKANLAEPLWGSSYAWGGESVHLSEFDVSKRFLMKEFTLVAEGDENYSLWLNDTPILSGTVGSTAVNETFNITLNLAQLVANEGTHFTLIKRSRLKAIMALKKKYSAVSLSKDAGIIELNMVGESKQSIVDTLSSISTNYVSQNVKRLAAEAESSLQFLDEQIPLVRTALIDSETALNAYRAKRDSVDLTLETKSLLERLVVLESEISSMAINEAEISRRFTPQHPNYLSFKRQQADLVVERGRLNARITNLPETQQMILSLMRDFEVNQAIYVTLQNKSQELAILKASTVGNVRVLDVPEVLPKASSPQRVLIVVLASIFGAILGVFLAFMKAWISRGISNPQQLQDIGLNLYTTIPVSEVQSNFDKNNRVKKLNKRNTPAKALLLANDYPVDLSVEAIRSLRTSLHFAMLEAKNNVVMFSSANAQVGKSFITSNLGVVLAQSNQKVIIVDADMRRGYLHKRFSKAVGFGLSQLLQGSESTENPIQKTSVENLDYVSRGLIPPNPSELLLSEYFSRFINKLSAEYDIVLIDTPPILAVTDAAIIARHASTLMLVARFEICTLKSVADAVNRFEINGLDVTGLIFNALEFKASNAYGGYGYGHYNYNYGYSYKYESLKD